MSGHSLASVFRIVRSPAALAAVAVLLCLFRLKAETTRRERTDCPPLESCSFRLQAEEHLRISGTKFIKANGSVFDWRGITAFRLLEFVAHGWEADGSDFRIQVNTDDPRVDGRSTLKVYRPTTLR